MSHILTLVLSISQASRHSKTQSLSHVQTHQRRDNPDNLTALDNDSMLLPHDRVVSDFSWLHASHEKGSTSKATRDLEDEELFLYGNYDTMTQKIGKTPSANVSQNGGQSKQELNIFAPQLQDEPTLGSLGDFVPKQPLQVTSSFVSSYLDSSECEKLKNILKSVNLASETQRNTQRPREENHLSPVPHGSDSEPGPKSAVKEKDVLQALESLQSLIKGKVLLFLSQPPSWCWSQIYNDGWFSHVS